ncbi:diguanylate cyclase [Actinoplanes sp. NPDC051411]|uniref:diguanylate cyclase domain-containing protein n=1 Tax=Actinoplanes sp. NPDC051411 TaxID=3155522 RepID=UPI00341C2460
MILEVDDLVLQVLGFAREDMVGHRSTDFIHADDHEQAFSSWVRMLGDPQKPYTIQVRHRTASGRWLWVEAINTVDTGDEASVETELTLIDRPADDRTTVSSQLLRHLAEALPFGIAQIDSDRAIVFSNGKLDDVCGQANGDHLDDRFGLIVATDLPVLDAAVKSVLAGDDSEIELSLSHPHRGVRRCAIILSALVGRSGYGTTGALLCVTDITDDARQRAEIIRRAVQDGLTACLNRAAILDVLTTAVAGCTDAAGVAVLFFDLDRFKQINDTHGHAAGDHLLVAVGERLRDGSRDADVGRLGGDEFLVIARGVPSAEQADRLGQRLAQKVRRPVKLRDTVIRPAISVGVAWSADPAADASSLVAQADAAMYRAKRRGAS